MHSKVAERWLQMTFVMVALLLCLVRFAFLRADFPNHSPWLLDQAKFTDEGWWSNAAVRHFLNGHWQVPGDYNPAAAVPAWPVLLATVFHFTGVSVVVARALSVVLSLATVGLVYLLVRAYGGAGSHTAGAIAALLLAASPFAYAFSRLVTLDSVVVFEWALLLWLASKAERGRTWPLLLLGAFIPIMLLTKTTAAALLPSVLWLLWITNRTKRAILVVAALAAAAMGLYLLLVLRSGYAEDYRYFFAINALAEIEWSRTGSLLLQLLRHGLWVDRILYPAALAVLLLSLVWLRQLWANPLFAASWIAIAGQAIYILRRQDDYAPRYFVSMLVPVILVVVLALQELRTRHRPLATLFAATLGIAMVLDVLQVVGFVSNRQYQFYNAAKSIQAIVSADPSPLQKPHRLLLGASGDQLSLMVGIPAINDGYSSQDLEQKVSSYQPGWYVGWNDLDQDILQDLSAYRLDKVATFPVFDNPQRNLLTLYRMVLVKENPR